MKKRIISTALTLLVVLAISTSTVLSAAVSDYTEIVPPGKYSYISFFNGGLAVVVDLEQKYGLINKEGDEVIVPFGKYDFIAGFSDGVSVVVDSNRKYGVIDDEGLEIIPPTDKYTRIGNFTGGMAGVWDNNGRRGVIDKTGKTVAAFGKYDGVRMFSSGVAIVISKDEYGVIDNTGDEIVPLGKYYYYGDFSEGAATVYDSEGNCGIIDSAGNEIVPLGKYTSVRNFSDGAAIVVEGGDVDKYGVVDIHGDELIPPTDKYDYISNFSDDAATVSTRGSGGRMLGVIDKTGGELIAPAAVYNEIGYFYDGTARVWDGDGRVGIIDKTGREIIPFGMYAGMSDFIGGAALVTDEEGKHYGIIDINGMEIVPLGTYDDIFYLYDGLAVVINYNNATNSEIFILISLSAAPLRPSPDVPSAPSSPPAQLTVYPTKSTVFIDEKTVGFDAFSINGENYFMLRDLALALSGSDKQFDIGYDENTKAISLISGLPYTEIGGEMAQSDGIAKTAKLNSDINISKDGEMVGITAYLIDGGNYVRLRDILKLFNIGVRYEAATRSIYIETLLPYTE